MPGKADDSVFGGKAGASSKAHAAIVKQYGLSKGETVYQSLVTKRRALAKAQRKHPR